MQLPTWRRVLGMDDDMPTNKDVELQPDESLEKGGNTTTADEEETQYPSFKVFFPSLMCIYLSTFLVALDRTIIGVAVPAISNEFNSFGEISWYEAAFLLTLSVFQLPMGKIYKYFPAKWAFVTSVAVFEIGSLICAAAPSSVAFIIGRAITGIGGAGAMVGGNVIMTDLLPLHKRPMYQGFLGAVFGLASVIGPLIGGAFTSKITWRWCFWINLPVGGIALAGLVFILPTAKSHGKAEGTLLQKIWKFDPIGNALLFPGLVCLVLALQWGGTMYSWSSGRIIGLLVAGSVLFVLFIGTQIWLQEDATIPPRIFCQRSIAAGAVVGLGIGAALVIPTFYLAIWFQAIKNISALGAGIRLLPYFLGTVFFVIGSGILISKIGYYTPLLIIGAAILVVGAGLLTTLRVDTTTGQWIGYQLVYGAGIGMTLQQGNIAAQTVLAKGDISTGISIIAFTNFFGGTVFLSLCQTILANTLSSQLARDLPGFDTSVISSTGATAIQTLVSKADLPIVLKAYNAGIDNTFYCALAVCCLAFVGSLFFEWKTVRRNM